MALVALVDALSSFGISFLEWTPRIVISLLILALGYLFGRLLGRAVLEISTRLKIDKRIGKTSHIKLKMSHLLDVVVRWVIYLVFLQQAASFLTIGIIEGFIGEIVGALPRFIGAGAIVLASYVIGMYFKDHIVASHTPYSDLTGKIIFFLIMYLGLSMAFTTVGFNTDLANNVLLILAGSLGLGLALALGLGLKNTVQDLSTTARKKHRRG